MKCISYVLLQMIKLNGGLAHQYGGSVDSFFYINLCLSNPIHVKEASSNPNGESANLLYCSLRRSAQWSASPGGLPVCGEDLHHRYPQSGQSCWLCFGREGQVIGLSKYGF